MTQGSAPKGTAPPVLVHATSISFCGKAALLRGASGSGKSAIALQAMALGAQLICDDQTQLCVTPEGLVASAAPNIAGMIEARGVGLLRAQPAPPAPVALLVDLDHLTTARLPEARQETLLGIALPCLHKVEGPHFPAAILQYLREGPAKA